MQEPTHHTEQPEENLTQAPEENTPSSLFSNGGFVIVLIAVALFITLITWSVSFATLFFGAVGTFLSVGSCALNHQDFSFKGKKLHTFEDENWAYFAIRALIGGLFGTALTLLAIGHITDATHWSVIAVLSIFGGFIFDTLMFKKLNK